MRKKEEIRDGDSRPGGGPRRRSAPPVLSGCGLSASSEGTIPQVWPLSPGNVASAAEGLVFF